ncbi:hypothetical protein GALMADRAFT_245777 [Galerina marginata CBS 339.88]|uniref:protein-tyrosine-phosphatase n=1 Tax=Galerina marginata (strain CBS 339.88) TaxID=685588 RepID=A0A067T5J9_GALM3|nr:hypothetical protein GALMADRAFT_245777 [Galerina marginata CBS 339.88]
MIRFDNLPPEVMQAMCTPMHQILPPTPLPPSHSHPSPSQTGALYLGSLSAVQDPTTLRQHHISHLVQVLDVPWLPLSEKDGFDCFKIEIQDENSVDIRPYLESVCAYIGKALGQGRSVLVHCQQVSWVCEIVFVVFVLDDMISAHWASGPVPGTTRRWRSLSPCLLHDPEAH